MSVDADLIVVLGTGGTIAGRSARRDDDVGYRAGEVPVADLLGDVPVPAGVRIEPEQVAQLDSKDMDRDTWAHLATRAHHHLSRPEVRALLVTHGTDTLEETAWLLHRLLAPRKPLVLTAAMRPGTALQPDGPQNLADALAVAACDSASGVVAVLGGRVLAAQDVRKLHPFRVDAFEPGDEGPVARVVQGTVRALRPWPQAPALGLDVLTVAGPDKRPWPWVEIVTSHADARGEMVDLLAGAGVDGLVVAGTGNASVHARLADALQRASARGVTVRLTSRCIGSAVVPAPGAAWPVAEGLTPAQARVDLWLDLRAARAASRGGHA